METNYTDRVYDVRETIVIGDGNATRVCRDFGLTMLGQGNGPHAAEMSPWGGATLFRWRGAEGGTVIRVAGPISSCEVGGFTIDCDGVAGVGLELAHPIHSRFHDITIANPRLCGVWMHGVGQARGGVEGNSIVMNCGRNSLERINVLIQHEGAIGWQIGVDDDTATFGVSQNSFIHCGVDGTGAAGQIGWLLRGCDSNYARFLSSVNVEQPLRLESPRRATYPGAFPYSWTLVKPYLWTPIRTPRLPFITWSDNWAPENVGLDITAPIQESGGPDVKKKQQMFPCVVELSKHPRAIIYRGTLDEKDEG